MRGLSASAPTGAAWEFFAREHPTALAFDATGAVVAAADAAGELTLVDTENGSELARFRADGLGATCLAWHPRDRCVAVGGQSGRVGVYGRDGLRWEAHVGPRWVEHVRWDPSGTRLAVALSKTVFLLDDGGATLATSKPEQSTLTGLEFRAGGRQIVTCCYGGVAVHDAATLAVIRRFRWTGSMLGLALSPSDKVVACGGQDATVHFWRFADGRDAQMSGYPRKPKSLSWSHDSRWLATSGSPDVIVWPFDGRGPEGRSPLVLRAHESPVELVAFEPAGRGLVSACESGGVALWAPGTRAEPIAFNRLDARAVAIAWARRGDATCLAVADAGGRIQGWSVS